MKTLLSWNVAGRVQRQPEQAVLIAGSPLTSSASRRSDRRPSTPGLQHSAAPAGRTQHSPNRNASAGDADRRLSVLTAARAPLTELQIDGDLPWPERALATDVNGLHLVNLHSPISPRPDLVKVRTHETIHAYLTHRPGPTALCGDLNTPRKEHPDGRVWTFARTRHGKLRPERGERWDRAELALIKGLEPLGFRDAFRDLHGYERKELSWQCLARRSRAGASLAGPSADSSREERSATARRDRERGVRGWPATASDW